MRQMGVSPSGAVAGSNVRVCVYSPSRNNKSCDQRLLHISIGRATNTHIGQSLPESQLHNVHHPPSPAGPKEKILINWNFVVLLCPTGASPIRSRRDTAELCRTIFGCLCRNLQCTGLPVCHWHRLPRAPALMRPQLHQASHILYEIHWVLLLAVVAHDRPVPRPCHATAS